MAAMWLAALAAGCSAVVDPDVGKLGGRPLSCTPYQPNPCVCQGGAFGTQLCNAGGSYDPCNCGTVGSAGSSNGGTGGSSGTGGNRGQGQGSSGKN